MLYTINNKVNMSIKRILDLKEKRGKEKKHINTQTLSTTRTPQRQLAGSRVSPIKPNNKLSHIKFKTSGSKSIHMMTYHNI